MQTVDKSGLSVSHVIEQHKCITLMWKENIFVLYKYKSEKSGAHLCSDPTVNTVELAFITMAGLIKYIGLMS